VSTETRTHVLHAKADERLAKKLEELNWDEDKSNKAKLDPDFWAREATKFRNAIEIGTLSSFSLFYNACNHHSQGLPSPRSGEVLEDVIIVIR
jgi:hypothetical protein